MKRKKPVALTEQELDEALGASPLLRLKSRLSRNEAALTRKEISTSFAALDAIEAIFSALQKGYSPEQLAAVFPEAWGKQTLAVPLPVVATLAYGWSTYRHAPAGKTLGECFKIEAIGGQGKVPTKKTSETKRRAFGYAYAVLKDYALAITQGTPISLENAVKTISDARGVSIETVKAALKRHRDEAEALLREQGWWK